MAEQFLALIPADPYAALPETADALRNALAKMLNTTEARVKDYGKLQFIDCGQNFARVTCPTCRADIPMEQWHIWMDEDWHGAEGFHLHTHATPCCAAQITLNTLDYDAPQGFAHWFVGARLDDATRAHSDLQSLEDLAGLKLRAIVQQY